VAPVDFGPVSIIGLGVIGGSVAQSLTRQRVAVRSYTQSATDAAAAGRAGVAVARSVADCVAQASLVLIAVPLSARPAVAAEAAAAAPRDAVLLHAGSLQGARALGRTTSRPAKARDDMLRRIVGTHPIAGSHRTGFSAARADLFAGCVVSIEARADARTRAGAEWLWRAVGATRFDYRSADDHDRLMTWVSHLPQLASTALADAIASAGVPAEALGPGGRGATRLAASPFEMWSGILAAAGPEAAAAAAALESSVHSLRAALESADLATLERMWTRARQWREPRDADAMTAADISE
jgi:prephenate dehydrogenase